MADVVIGPDSITWHGTKESLLEFLRNLPQNLGQLHDEILEGVGQDLKGILHEAFLVKAQGDTDEAGIRWDDLADETVRQKKRNKVLKGVAVGEEDKYFRRLGRRLVMESFKRMWQFTRRLRRVKSKIARIYATKVGGQSLKLPGLLKKQEELRRSIMKEQAQIRKGGGRPVREPAKGNNRQDILIDEHKLEQSIDPKLSIPESAEVSVVGNMVSIKFTEKPWHHTGFNAPSFVGRVQKKKGRVSKGRSGGKREISRLYKLEREAAKGGKTHYVKPRRFFPEDGNLPDVWWGRILEGVFRRFGGAISGVIMAQEQRSR